MIVYSSRNVDGAQFVCRLFVVCHFPFVSLSFLQTIWRPLSWAKKTSNPLEKKTLRKRDGGSSASFCIVCVCVCEIQKLCQSHSNARNLNIFRIKWIRHLYSTWLFCLCVCMYVREWMIEQSVFCYAATTALARAKPMVRFQPRG